MSLQLFLRYGLCLIILFAPFFRGLFFESHFLPFVIGISILFIIYLYHQYKQRESGFFSHPLDWAILALLLAYIFSLITAVNIRAAIGGVMKYAVYFMVFWMCYRAARQNKGFNYLYLSFYLAGVGMALFALLVYSGVVSYPYTVTADNRIAGTLEYANTFGAYSAVVSILGWALAMSKERLSKAAISGANALVILAALGSLSRGTWLLYPFAVLAFVLFVGREKRWSAVSTWLCFFVPALIISRWSLTSLTGSTAVLLFVTGFCLAASLQWGIDYLNKIAAQQNISKRTLLVTALSGSLILILVLFYSIGIRTSINQNSLTRLTNISFQDENVQLRLDFNRDAIKIVKDYPLTGTGSGGWEALYHQYASHLYWSNYTHNYFLQTWAEAGTLGFLALLVVWTVFIYLLWKHHKKTDVESHNDTMFWGGAIAIFLLGAHSLIDFDMSYPAIAFVLFGLMGTLKGISFYKDNNDPLVARRDKQERKKHNAKDRINSKDLIFAISAALLATVIAVFATSFWLAHNYFVSAQKIMNQSPNQSLVLLEKSIQYDSLNANYVNQLASLYAAVAVSTSSQAAYQQALDLCQKAVKLEPHNIKILNNINRIYLELGQTDQAIKVSESLIQVNPIEPSTYENLANTLVFVGLSNLDAGQTEKARYFWEEALKVSERVPSNIACPPVGLNYTSGMAKLLLGETEQGQQLLKSIFSLSLVNDSGVIFQQRVDQANDYYARSRVWLSASFEVSGDTAQSNKYWQQLIVTNKHQEMDNYFKQAKAWLQKANPNP